MQNVKFDLPFMKRLWKRLDAVRQALRNRLKIGFSSGSPPEILEAKVIRANRLEIVSPRIPEGIRQPTIILDGDYCHKNVEFNDAYGNYVASVLIGRDTGTKGGITLRIYGEHRCGRPVIY